MNLWPIFIFADESFLGGINAIWAFLAILIAIGGAVLILLSRWKGEVEIVETKRANANADLVKTRDAQILDLDKRKADLEGEVEDVTAELRTLTGINLKELFGYWAIRESELARIADLEQQIRILKMRKGIEE